MTYIRHRRLLLSSRADTHFTVPRRVEGWVNLGTQHAALYNIIQDYIAHGCEKLVQGFYMAATWPEVEPYIYDTPVRRSLPVSQRAIDLNMMNPAVAAAA